MATVHDVATYILSQIGAVSAMKLQKLVYYSQAWHLALVGPPLFDESIEAWAYGPVVYELYQKHRGQFVVQSLAEGSADAITDGERELIDDVIRGYGHLDGSALSKLTHSESPWLDARGGAPDRAFSRSTIDHESMRAFYAKRPRPWLA